MIENFNMQNRRGITLTSNVEKLFERVLNNRLVKILEFSEGQAGGRKQRSTVDQLFILKSLINEAKINKTRPTGLMLTCYTL